MSRMLLGLAQKIKEERGEKAYARFWYDMGSNAKWSAVEQLKVDHVLANGGSLEDLKFRKDVYRIIKNGKVVASSHGDNYEDL